MLRIAHTHTPTPLLVLAALVGVSLTACGNGSGASGDTGHDETAADGGQGGTGADLASSAAAGSGTETATAGYGGGTNRTGSAGAAGAGEGPGDGEVYANVVAVSATGTPGEYQFAVSVESADVDCNQFADWWEVLSEDGALLYRRILEHSHTDENGTSDADAPGNTFTRDGGPVPVAADEVVVVRAHMNIGGYDGAVMRGSVEDGFATVSDLAPGLAAGVETEEPQPDECLF